MTGYPEADAVLTRLRDEVGEVLGVDLVGMYFYGSLALGDYDPDSSDIDFVVATANRLTAEQVRVLKDTHERILASGLAAAHELEGSYVPVAQLRRYDSDGPGCPGIGVDLPFGVRGQGPDWVINRHVIREHSPALFGPDPKTLIDPISPDELRHTVVDLVGSWTRSLENPSWLRLRNYQAFAVLTMCRMLHTLETGDVATKPVAAAWARGKLPAPWTGMVDRALEWRRDHAPDDMDETLAFIRFVLGEVARRGSTLLG
jgi:predicted nucleotidyltransferase